MLSMIAAWLLLFQTTFAVTATDAQAAYTALQTFYNTSSGLWDARAGWWHSANCLTVIADLAAIDSSVKTEALSVFPTTFTRAQQWNRQRGNNSFEDQYYDDEGWWALALIAVYDVTGNQEYLQGAETLFENIQAAYGTTPCGGVWWDKAHTKVNAITNELFMSVAAHLANRVTGKMSYYVGWAEKSWVWLQKSGLINSQNLINDRLQLPTCRNNGDPIHTYTQGVPLGGLAELARATGNDSYITEAQTLANASIPALTKDGILHELCEPNCDTDGDQFKGIFPRNLVILYKQSPVPMYANFLQTNADSIWANDRNSENQFGLVWSGPFQPPANAEKQSSAMDAIIGALAVSSAESGQASPTTTASSSASPTHSSGVHGSSPQKGSGWHCKVELRLLYCQALLLSFLLYTYS